jgi:DNA segregation ATPase FtsK/SpoIIIE, S-DNA-T family
MGRKKKNSNNSKEEEVGGKLDLSFSGDTKRSVFAIALFALALLILLGFIGKAGVVGESLNKITGIFIGWAKFIFPIFLTMAGIVLLLRKETSFYISKLTGLLIALVALSGFFHWLYNINEMKEIAAAGSGGGYIGYAVAYGAVKYLEKPGGFVVILALFLMGVVVSFDFPIVSLLHKLKEIKERKKEEELLAQEEAAPDYIEEEKSEIPEEAQAAGQKTDDNIGNIEFVEGSDRYVDAKLLAKLSSGVDSIKKKIRKSRRASEEDGQVPENGEWQLPPLSLLESAKSIADPGDQKRNEEVILRTFKHFGIEGEVGETTVGPTVSQYTFRPAFGIKLSRVLGLQNDLALALSARSIRIEAPIPGKPWVGIEIPNRKPADVKLRDILESQDFLKRKSNLTLAIGKDVGGNHILGNLAKMPHLMIAGATGAGKSVAVNSIIVTLLYQNSPKDLKFIMVDPKRVELSLYNKIPHLLADVIVENKKAFSVLKWAIGEMERRYRLMQDFSSKDIASFNQKVEAGEKRRYTDLETGEVIEEEVSKMPYIVIVIDEVAELMVSHGKEVEGAIVRLAQLARAVGIHLIVSTQRPEVKIITGLIKSNITSRIAFQVPTQVDSRTILDIAGAEKLLGNGDMLYVEANSPKPKRVQGPLISENEIKEVVKFILDQKARYEKKTGEEISQDIRDNSPENFKESEAENEEDGDTYERAKEEVIRSGKASATLLQRRLRIGYPKAARILDMLEEKGIVGPADGAKPREVYASQSSGEPSYEDPDQDQQKREKWQM